VYEREVAREAVGDPERAGASLRLAKAISRYEIFPPTLLTGVLRRWPVEVGDTVGGCYHLMPGIDLFFASRVVACFDERVGNLWRSGFTYHTLAGHPELGAETFSVEKDLTTGSVGVALRSWSRPGILLSRVLTPVVRLLQVRASRAALDHLARVAATVGDPVGQAARLPLG
jgi:hypothetical protein